MKIGNLEVMTEDLGEMTWDDAMQACTDLGDGWGLPTQDELQFMYENKDKIGGYEFNYYWTSKEFRPSRKFRNTNAWKWHFGNGNYTTSKKTNTACVRAVRAF